MRVNARALLSATTIMLVLAIPSAAWAQHKHTQSGQKKPGMAGMKSEMSKMMKSPHHMLMTAHMKSMSEFAKALRDQAVKPNALDVEFARAAVAELRHSLDAMESRHQNNMQTMSAEMKSKTQMMMEKMEKDRSTLRDQISALETDVQADKPDSKQVAAHTNALLKHLGRMAKMHVGGAKAQQQPKAPSGNMKGMDMEGMNKRGDRVMGFDHDKTTHHFRLLPDGGVIEVEANDAKDTASRDQIRMHLRHIASMFANGNFEAPMLIHSQTPPGVPVMKTLKAEIKYQFEEMERGGRVRITTSNTEGLAAVYEFLRFQIKEHQTGDSGQVEKEK
jgi:polyhydroxyalkanoate synthesis regulator phasin